MSGRDPRAFLSDIREACDGISSRLADRTLDEYKGDGTLRLACERLLGIVGEACAQIRKTSPELAPEIGDINRIVAFRNLLVHGYFKLVDEIIWEIASTDVPQLRAQVDSLLRRLGSP